MKKIFLILVMLTCTLFINSQKYSGKKNIDPNIKLNNEYCTGVFQSAHGTILNLLDDNTSAQGYLNILDWMDGRVAGLQVYSLRNGLRIPFIRGTEADIFVDEMQTDAGYLRTLSVNDIAIIKIIKGPFVGAVGNGGGGGVIAIYTIKADEDEDEEEISIPIAIGTK
jgi:hypothetical protein